MGYLCELEDDQDEMYYTHDVDIEYQSPEALKIKKDDKPVKLLHDDMEYDNRYYDYDENYTERYDFDD